MPASPFRIAALFVIDLLDGEGLGVYVLRVHPISELPAFGKYDDIPRILTGSNILLYSSTSYPALNCRSRLRCPNRGEVPFNNVLHCQIFVLGK